MKKILSLILALVLMFSAATVSSATADELMDGDSGIELCFDNASQCESTLTCTSFKATMTLKLNIDSDVIESKVLIELYKYTSDGWVLKYVFTEYPETTGAHSFVKTTTISPFYDYCMKTTVVLRTSTLKETITQYRYS